MLRLRTSPNILVRAFATVLLTPVTKVDYARLETASLKDVTDDYYYGCSCQPCLHTARLSLSKLRAHLGADFPLRKIRERLKARSAPAAKSVFSVWSSRSHIRVLARRRRPRGATPVRLPDLGPRPPIDPLRHPVASGARIRLNR